MKYYFFLVFVIFSQGCTDKNVPVILQTLNPDTGEITETVANYTSKASIEKERYYSNMRVNRDMMRAKMHENSGFSLEWKAVDETITIQAPGQSQPVIITMSRQLPEVSYKPDADFSNDPLPNGPSVHPVWKTVENTGKELMKWGAIGFGIHELFGFASAAVDGAGDKYYGDSYKQQSDNETYGDYSPMTFDQKDPLQNSKSKPLEDSFECVSGYVPLYLGGCSCDSYLENGHSCQ